MHLLHSNLILKDYYCQSMAVIYIPQSLSGHGIEPQQMHEIINPSYSPVTEDQATQTEGCYSVRYDQWPFYIILSEI